MAAMRDPFDKSLLRYIWLACDFGLGACEKTCTRVSQEGFVACDALSVQVLNYIHGQALMWLLETILDLLFFRAVFRPIIMCLLEVKRQLELVFKARFSRGKPLDLIYPIKVLEFRRYYNFAFVNPVLVLAVAASVASLSPSVYHLYALNRPHS